MSPKIQEHVLALFSPFRIYILITLYRRSIGDQHVKFETCNNTLEMLVDVFSDENHSAQSVHNLLFTVGIGEYIKSVQHLHKEESDVLKLSREDEYLVLLYLENWDSIRNFQTHLVKDIQACL